MQVQDSVATHVNFAGMADLREGLDPLWGLLLTSWNRSMEAARKAPKTRKLYLDAATDTAQDTGVHHLGGGRAERADAGLQRQIRDRGAHPVQRRPGALGITERAETAASW
ncbi:hypothetical protein MXD62_15095 [Frankia sp. Mgl5]|uniref:hypothetical protein n=1 Tax=Frankia sp. Mgl5 TaxID=2933793 RepID=UPI00200BD3ED|nr:hypothetical protein [Frankia sp. Mgl5]MCK9928484.1 hypothetical protein [Frankia sp. Mgl5]